MKYRFYAHNTGREDFSDWCNINYVRPNKLTIEARYQKDQLAIGAPLHEERPTPDGTGRYRTYEHASIHWHPLFGAFVTLGGIREAWRNEGWENGWLGLPVSDEFSVSQYDIEDMTSFRWGETEDGLPPERNDASKRSAQYAQAQQFYGGLIIWVRDTSHIEFLIRSERNFRGCPLFQMRRKKQSWIERIFPNLPNF